MVIVIVVVFVVFFKSDWSVERRAAPQQPRSNQKVDVVNPDPEFVRQQQAALNQISAQRQQQLQQQRQQQPPSYQQAQSAPPPAYNYGSVVAGEGRGNKFRVHRVAVFFDLFLGGWLCCVCRSTKWTLDHVQRSVCLFCGSFFLLSSFFFLLSSCFVFFSLVLIIRLLVAPFFFGLFEKHRNGYAYFYNSVTKVSQWSPPAGMQF